MERQERKNVRSTPLQG